MEFKHNFVLFLKTYKNDLDRTKILVKSIIKFNRDNIPLYISVPSSDFQIFDKTFKEFNSTLINLLKDEDICNELIDSPINSFNIGYINQQIIKLTFWKSAIANHFLCLDSDSYFIKDFYISDFMYDSNTPYEVLVQDKELSLDPSYKTYYFQRKPIINSIFNKVGNFKKDIKTNHNSTIFSSNILKSFQNKYLKGAPLSNILKDESFEFSWYNAWLQNQTTVDYKSCEPFFKMFHTKDQYFDCLRNNSEDDIKKEYLGICLNSNWADKLKVSKYGELPTNRMIFFKIEKVLFRFIKVLRKI